jgi:hypothetical protein
LAEEGITANSDDIAELNVEKVDCDKLDTDNCEDVAAVSVEKVDCDEVVGAGLN